MVLPRRPSVPSATGRRVVRKEGPRWTCVDEVERKCARNVKDGLAEWFLVPLFGPGLDEVRKQWVSFVPVASIGPNGGSAYGRGVPTTVTLRKSVLWKFI
jgi:hypothetical protein